MLKKVISDLIKSETYTRHRLQRGLWLIWQPFSDNGFTHTLTLARPQTAPSSDELTTVKRHLEMMGIDAQPGRVQHMDGLKGKVKWYKWDLTWAAARRLV